ncbi:MAG: AraC family transcriptional regulator [Defluviitaleaceae bacterium]|nr:AraC family transcriptional regulator [Defluviitaleaceae bacterium]MCL2238935.1 AraC family transcriptional regulator [Defluviitaleaceae bacterium]
MTNFIAPCGPPFELRKCGYFMDRAGFFHARHIASEVFVLILGDKGTLCVEQNGQPYEIGHNQFILLRPGFEHLHKPGAGDVAYYWCHFHVPQYRMGEIDPDIDKDCVIIPETGDLRQPNRVLMRFKQLLDAGARDAYTDYIKHYALTMLLLEISADFVGKGESVDASHKQIPEIIQWIHSRYSQHLSVTQVAAMFNYHPGYLSSIFKKYTGMTLLEYIIHIKIDTAKHMLLASDSPIKRIAREVGFTDEKYFMKVFKRLEGISPSQFRHAFSRR